ncbi:hypothetical protein B9Z55_007298 [Caenorhabditis nigoni]|nr:hypothetical protein B9Z55_007298 [Caenorhabditis nigoni]
MNDFSAMSSSGSVSSGVDLDALEEWTTTTIANLERGVEEKLAEMDSKVRDLENSNASLKENCKDLDELHEKINELENTVKALTEEKEAHILKIATLDDQWRGAVKQAIEDRVEFGKKTKESEEAMRELSGKVEMLENELVQKNKKICEIHAASKNKDMDLNKLREENEKEVGKTREEVERLQGLLKNLEEENGTMKKAIEILEQDKKTQYEKINELECTVVQVVNERLALEKTIENKDKAAGELIAKLVRLEMELVQKRKDLRDISLANQNEKIDLKKLSEDHELEIGKAREELEWMQGLLREVEEENGIMKNAMDSLIEDKDTQSQESRLEMVGMQQAVMNMEAEMEDLQEQHRQDFSKLRAAMGTELAQKEEIIVELTSKVQESGTKIQNVSKDYEEKIANLQEDLKTQKALLGEQRIMEAQKIEKAERERSLLKQTIKDLSTALESMRRDQKWIPMMEEQLEDADNQLESEKSARKLESEEMTAKIGKLSEEFQRLQEQLEKAGEQLESEKAARKLDIEAKTAEIGKLNEAHLTELNRLQEQYDQEQVLRHQLNSKYIEMEMARIQSEEEKEALKRELVAKENEVKLIMEYEKNEAEEAAGRYARLQTMLKRKNSEDVAEQPSAKRRAPETIIPRPGTF